MEPDPNVRLFLERAFRQTEAIVLVTEHAEAALAAVATQRGQARGSASKGG